MSEIFLGLIFNVPLALAASWNSKFFSHSQVVIKMAWYGDVRFQRKAVIERLVAEKWLKNVYGVNAVDKSTVSRWIHHLEPQTARRSVDWHRPASQNRTFNLLKTKRNLPYIRNQYVPRCKHFPPRL
jgi:hypothetical protein